MARVAVLGNVARQTARILVIALRNLAVLRQKRRGVRHLETLVTLVAEGLLVAVEALRGRRAGKRPVIRPEVALVRKRKSVALGAPLRALVTRGARLEVARSVRLFPLRAVGEPPWPAFEPGL
jgi:hypothetical protein